MLADGIEDPNDLVSKRFAELAKSEKSGLVRLYIASSLPRFDSDQAIEIAFELSKHASDSQDRVQPKLIWYGLEPFVAACSNKADSVAVSESKKLIDLASSSAIPLLRRNIVRRLTNEIDQPNHHVDKIVDMLIEEDDPEKSKDIVEAMQLALNGWSEAPLPAKWSQVTEKLAALKDSKIDKAMVQLDIVFGEGRSIEELKKRVGDNQVDFATRRKAILTLANSMESGELYNFLKPHMNNRGLANAVAGALVHCDNRKVGSLLLRRFGQLDPAGQTIAINTLSTRPAWASALLDFVDQGKIGKGLVSAAHARQIMNMGDGDLTRKLIKVWGEVRQTSAERQKEIEDLRGVLTSGEFKPDVKNGGELYTKNCASCHTIFGTGGKTGPDLTGSDRRNLNYLLENILDPSASVAAGFAASIIELEDGRVLTGVVTNENQRVMELQTKDELLTIDLKTIARRKKTRNSLMPEGLLNGLSKQQIADLFGFLAK